MRNLILPLLLSLACLPVACDDSGRDARVTSAAPVALRFQVDGMHCEGCASAITEKVSRVDGVVDCRVSLENREASVAVRGAETGPAVQAAIERLGYKVKPLTEPSVH
jgi:copper chaperone CopZ